MGALVRVNIEDPTVPAQTRFSDICCGLNAPKLCPLCLKKNGKSGVVNFGASFVGTWKHSKRDRPKDFPRIGFLTPSKGF